MSRLIVLRPPAIEAQTLSSSHGCCLYHEARPKQKQPWCHHGTQPTHGESVECHHGTIVGYCIHSLMTLMLSVARITPHALPLDNLCTQNLCRPITTYTSSMTKTQLHQKSHKRIMKQQ
eukprot:GHUV01033710.1.p2 GENE.GHUV01033710.1~~GHUV01033710.1.p2  ORF type:complete len:119 (-),score=15.89 GHUV01033710.1:651-1007(-)